MTITLAAVYAPIGLMGGLTGSMFREFAFTLAGSVIVSGVVALTLSPMMSAQLLGEATSHGRFARFVEHQFAKLSRGYGRLLAATLKMRAAVLLVAVSVLAAIVVLFLGSQRELARRRRTRAMCSPCCARRNMPASTTRRAMPTRSNSSIVRFRSITPAGWSTALTARTDAFGGITPDRLGQAQALGQQHPEPALRRVLRRARRVGDAVPAGGAAGGDRRPAVPDGGAFGRAVSPASIRRSRGSSRPPGRAGCSPSSTATSHSTIRPRGSPSITPRLPDPASACRPSPTPSRCWSARSYVNRFNFFERSYSVIPQVRQVDRVTPEISAASTCARARARCFRCRR